jgi:protein SCO1/2
MRRTNIERLMRIKSIKLSALFILAIANVCLGSSTATAQVKSHRLPARSLLAQEASRPATPQEKAPQTTADEQNKAERYFTQVVLVNQFGEKMRLYNDLLKDKVIIINFFFATCQGSCLPMSRNLQKVQEALGERVGKDVHIISISVDPTVDTPARLKEYARKLDARPGWYFLTGEKANVEFALRKLGQYVEDKQGHTNIFIIGNERTGLWKKAFGLAKSDELIKIVESVLNDQPTGGR